jgi:hypothetical protein
VLALSDMTYADTGAINAYIHISSQYLCQHFLTLLIDQAMDIALYPVLKSYREYGLTYFYLSKILFFSIQSFSKIDV